jgi:5'-methylthioadenosine phosphorylase
MPGDESTSAPSDGLLAVVGGTSLLKSTLFSSLARTTVHTPLGDATLYTGDLPSGRPIVFLQRHHADADPDEYRPPHMINHRKSFAALQSLGVTRMVAICSVGGLTTDIPIGSVVLPDDYFYLFGPPVSFYDDARAHIVPSMDAKLRMQLIDVLTTANTPGLLRRPATYVQTTGPRFETRAEVRFLGTLGHIIGMTAASEATMAAELTVPYAVIAMVDNFANGVADVGLTSNDFHANVKTNQATVETAVGHVMDALA